MRQKPGTALLYVWLVHHFLKKGGTQTLKLQLLYCLQVLYDYNPWFPSKEGTLDLKSMGQSPKEY